MKTKLTGRAAKDEIRENIKAIPDNYKFKNLREVFCLILSALMHPPKKDYEEFVYGAHVENMIDHHVVK